MRHTTVDPIYGAALTSPATAVQTWKVDRRSWATSRDVVGLYMAPPENALVLAVDEKSQMQAIYRIRWADPARRAHDTGANHRRSTP